MTKEQKCRAYKLINTCNSEKGFLLKRQIM